MCFALTVCYEHKFVYPYKQFHLEQDILALGQLLHSGLKPMNLKDMMDIPANIQDEDSVDQLPWQYSSISPSRIPFQPLQAERFFLAAGRDGLTRTAGHGLC